MMMPEHFSMLTLSEEEEAKLFWKQLSTQEKRDVIAILNVVDETAYEMLSGITHLSAYRYGLKDKPGYPFYAVYSIGGMVAKEPPRPDIDLLLACNVWYSRQQKDPFQSGRLNFERFESTREDIEVRVKGKLEKGYADGISDAKLVLEIQPAAIERRIHLVYVKSFSKRTSSLTS